MLLKNHLIEVFKKASAENNFLLKENIVLKWVHRFGIDSLNDLLIHSSVKKENHYEKVQEQISLIDEVHGDENKEKIKLESFKTSENLEKSQCESNDLGTSINSEVHSINQDVHEIKKNINTSKLPLPYIRNLRRWINNDKKAS